MADALAELTHSRLDRTIDLLARLVAEPSVEGSKAIGRCLTIVGEEVGPLARSVEWPTFDGLGTLVALFGDGPADRRLIFSGHVDVVPVESGWETPAFELTQRGDRLVGRGACDMKGGVAAFVGALQMLDEVRLLDECSLELVLTGDEEVGSKRGTIALLEKGILSGRAAVCGEPTGLDVFLGNRGLIWLEIAVRGRGGHAGLSHLLANPVPAGAALVSQLHELPLPALDKRFDPPRPSLSVTRIDAGAVLRTINVIPETVVLGVDRRLLPGEEPDQAIAAIRAVVEEVVRPPFRADVTVLRTWPPYVIREDEPVARAALEAVKASGRRGKFGTDLAANDSSWLVAAGIPTVLLGPGLAEEAHTTGEGISAADLATAVEAYARLALALTRG